MKRSGLSGAAAVRTIAAAVEEGPGPARLLVILAAGLPLYLLSQWLAFAATIQPQNISVFWPPAGVMLAMLVMTPRRHMLFVAGLLAIATLFSNLLAGRSAGLSAMLVFNDIATGLVGAILYRKFLGKRSPVTGIKPFGLFLLVVAVSAFLSATVGSAIVNRTFGVPITETWDHWFGAMALGILMAVPLFLLLPASDLLRSRWLSIDPEALACVLGAAVFLALAYGGLVQSPEIRIASAIAIIPLLLWVAVRYEAMIACILLSAVTVLEILASSHGKGMFVLQSLPAHGSVVWIMAEFTIRASAVLMLVASRSEQRALEQQRAHQAARLVSIVDAATDGIIAIDEHGIIETFSKSAEQLFGYAAPEVVGENVKVLMPAGYREHHDGYLNHYMKTGERRIIGIGRIVTGQRKDGSTFPMELSVGEAMDGARRVFTGFIRNITDRQEAERKFRELQDELLHVSRLGAMGELASAIAHELNQPLTAITNYAQAARIMVEKKSGMDDLPAILGKTAEQATRAGAVIRQLRTFVTARQVERTNQKVNQLIEEACALAVIGAREDGIQVKIQHGKNIPDVRVDRIQIQQILINLVRNAADAVLQGKQRVITIASKATASQVIIDVTDSGPGISEEGARNLFKPFVTTKPGGMGIGLSLSRGIAEAHGGTLSYHPNPSGGAIFTLRLPVQEPTGAELEASDTRDSHPRDPHH